MIRILIPLILFFCAYINAYAESNSVNLDELNEINLTYNSQYLLDPSRQFNLETAKNALDWSLLKRDQLKLGFVDSDVWLKQTFTTTGTKNRETVLAFSKIIDRIEIFLIDDQQNTTINFNTSHPIHTDDIITTNKNHVVLQLSPNKTYSLYVKFSSNNAVNGSVTLWGDKAFEKNNQYELYWLITYTVSIFIILIYNIAAFFSTRHRAFIYHSIYGISILVFQFSQYDYIGYFLETSSFREREQLIILSLSIAFICVLYFIESATDYKKQNHIFSNFNRFYIAVISVITLSATIMSYQETLKSLVIVIALCILTSSYFIVRSIKPNRKDAYILSAIFLLLVPSATTFSLNRFGIINESFWTEYMLLISIIIEMLLISGLLFLQIRRINNSFIQVQYFNSESLLPNINAFKENLQNAIQYKDTFSILTIWLSGLEKMEIAFGRDFYLKFISDLSLILNRKLGKLPNIHTHKVSNHSNCALFSIEKNTFALITDTISKNELEEIHELVTQYLDTLKHQYRYNSEVVPIITGAHSSYSATQADILLQRARIALAYSIKNNANQLIYNKEIGYTEHKQITLINDLNDAIQKNQLFLQWQPQFSATEQKIVGLEALVRWQHPKYGFIPPVEFIPLFEQSMQITQLSRWVLKQVFSDAPLISMHLTEIDISVNLSAYDLLDKKLLPYLDKLIKQSPNVVKHITLEVTESVMIEDDECVIETVKQLQQRGFKLSIDDFGAGYASFGYLQTLPANELKIDQRYAKTYKEKSSQAIISSIINLAKNLKMGIVIEGIEHKNQIDFFTKRGAERLQGWKLGKPMSRDEVIETYKEAEVL